MATLSENMVKIAEQLLETAQRIEAIEERLDNIENKPKPTCNCRSKGWMETFDP